MAATADEGRLVFARIAGTRHLQRLEMSAAVFESIADRDEAVARWIEARQDGRAGPHFVERGERLPPELRRYGIHEASIPLLLTRTGEVVT